MDRLSVIGNRNILLVLPSLAHFQLFFVSHFVVFHCCSLLMVTSDPELAHQSTKNALTLNNQAQFV